jgi:tetratricopeptide (TPR) repeat protein
VRPAQLAAAALGALLLLSPVPGQAPKAQETTDQYNCPALYDSGDYVSAASCFSSLEANGNHNGHLLYNLGNALQQAGETGEAILAYRRAQLFLPRDGDLVANLASARDKARDDLSPPGQREALAATLLAPYDSLSAAELLLLGTLAWALLFALLTLRSWRAEPLLSLPVVLLAVLAMLALGGHVARSYQVSKQPTGVVLADEVTLRSGRDLRSVELARLHEGAELTVLDEVSDWTQVRLSTGQRGWLPRSSLGLTRFVLHPEDR